VQLVVLSNNNGLCSGAGGIEQYQYPGLKDASLSQLANGSKEADMCIMNQKPVSLLMAIDI
jgi:hypothetical protein